MYDPDWNPLITTASMGSPELVNVDSWPKYMVTIPSSPSVRPASFVETAKSSMPSPLKSPTATESPISELENVE